MNAAAGISSRLIWRMPVPTARRMPAASRRAAMRLRVGNRTVATATLNIPCGQHVDAERVVDRARRFVGDEAAEGRVDQLVEVDDPEADRHGQHQHEHLPDARVVPVDAELQAEVDPPERAERHRQLHAGRGQDADRVGVDLVVAVEVRREHDQQRR